MESIGFGPMALLLLILLAVVVIGIVAAFIWLWRHYRADE